MTQAVCNLILKWNLSSIVSHREQTSFFFAEETCNVTSAIKCPYLLAIMHSSAYSTRLIPVCQDEWMLWQHCSDVSQHHPMRRQAHRRKYWCQQGTTGKVGTITLKFCFKFCPEFYGSMRILGKICHIMLGLSLITRCKHCFTTG